MDVAVPKAGGQDGATFVESRIAGFRTLQMTSKEIAEEFPDNQMVKQVMDGKRPMPSDPAKRAVYQVQIARLGERQEKERQEKKQQKKTAEAPAPVAPVASDTAKTAEELATAAAARHVRPAIDNAIGKRPGSGHPWKTDPSEQVLVGLRLHRAASASEGSGFVALLMMLVPRR